MKHILVATDFSDAAAAALREAAKLANLSGAKITLLHVIFAEKISETLLGLDAMEYLARAADESGPYDPERAMERLRETAREKLENAIASAPGPSVAIDAVVAEGRPSVEVVKFAAGQDVEPDA